MGVSSNVVQGGVEVVVHLRGVGMRLIGLVVDGEQEDAGNQRRRGRATGEQQCWSERERSAKAGMSNIRALESRQRRLTQEDDCDDDQDHQHVVIAQEGDEAC